MILFLFCLAIYGVAGFSASVLYHRVLTHRIARLKPWLLPLAVLLALPMGTPVQWVGTHRQHHRCTDVDGDPHSPLLFGFWYAHCGWYIQCNNPVICLLYALAGPLRMYIDGYWRPRTNLEYQHLAIDIQHMPFCRWVSRKWPYQWLLWGYATVLLGLAYYNFGFTGIGATWAMLVLVYNMGDAVNSLGHGTVQYSKPYHHARNLPIFALLSFGEGMHGNHHDNASQSNLSHPAHKDLGFLCLKLLVFMGLAQWNQRSNQ